MTVGASQDYGAVALALEERGWALANLASLPHISVGGAVATGTHGSGDRLGSLAAAVAAVELVGPDGSLRQVARGDAGFEGSVVALGALGVVTRLTLDVEPSYLVRQDVYTGMPWHVVESEFDAITAAADSVSLFTRLDDRGVLQVWCKSRSTDAPGDLFGSPRATQTLHMLDGAPAESVTDQSGTPGPWLERLAHFRREFTPSRGEELQSEYLVDRSAALEALAALRTLEPRLRPVLQTVEIRTVAARRAVAQWLLPAADRGLPLHLAPRRTGRVCRAAGHRGRPPAARRPAALGQVLRRRGRRPGAAVPTVGGLPRPARPDRS